MQRYLNAGDMRAVLRIAVKFRSLGEDDRAIRQGWEAIIRPEFQRQLRKNPDALVAAGIAAVIRHFKLKESNPDRER